MGGKLKKSGIKGRERSVMNQGRKVPEMFDEGKKFA